MKKIIYTILLMVGSYSFAQGYPKMETMTLVPQNAPTNPIEGQVYYDIGQKAVFVYNGSDWVNSSESSSISDATEINLAPAIDIDGGGDETNVQQAIEKLSLLKLNNLIEDRSGSSVDGIQLETEAELASNGEIIGNNVVLCSDCPPMILQTENTFEVNDFRGIDDRSNDSPEFVFSDVKPGAVVQIEANRLEDASYSGINFMEHPDSEGFVSNIEQLVDIRILPSGRAIRKYISLPEIIGGGNESSELVKNSALALDATNSNDLLSIGESGGQVSLNSSLQSVTSDTSNGYTSFVYRVQKNNSTISAHGATFYFDVDSNSQYDVKVLSRTSGTGSATTGFVIDATNFHKTGNQSHTDWLEVDYQVTSVDTSMSFYVQPDRSGSDGNAWVELLISIKKVSQ